MFRIHATFPSGRKDTYEHKDFTSKVATERLICHLEKQGAVCKVSKYTPKTECKGTPQSRKIKSFFSGK